MKGPPKGIKKPANARDLKEALQMTIPESSAGLIDVVVIDASVPKDKIELKASKKRARKKAGRITKKTKKKSKASTKTVGKITSKPKNKSKTAKRS